MSAAAQLTLSGTPGDVEQLDRECQEAGAQIWRAALIADRDLALEGAMAARRCMQSTIEIAMLVRIPWRDRLEGDPAAIRMRAPCRDCGHMAGIVRVTGGQHVVRCAGCARYAYCAPRSEVTTW